MNKAQTFVFLTTTQLSQPISSPKSQPQLSQIPMMFSITRIFLAPFRRSFSSVPEASIAEIIKSAQGTIRNERRSKDKRDEAKLDLHRNLQKLSDQPVAYVTNVLQVRALGLHAKNKSEQNEGGDQAPREPSRKKMSKKEKKQLRQELEAKILGEDWTKWPWNGTEVIYSAHLDPCVKSAIKYEAEKQNLKPVEVSEVQKSIKK